MTTLKIHPSENGRMPQRGPLEELARQEGRTLMLLREVAVVANAAGRESLDEAVVLAAREIAAAEERFALARSAIRSALYGLSVAIECISDGLSDDLVRSAEVAPPVLASLRYAAAQTAPPIGPEYDGQGDLRVDAEREIEEALRQAPWGQRQSDDTITPEQQAKADALIAASYIRDGEAVEAMTDGIAMDARYEAEHGLLAEDDGAEPREMAKQIIDGHHDRNGIPVVIVARDTSKEPQPPAPVPPAKPRRRKGGRK